MDAADGTERLDLERRERTRKPGIAAVQRALQGTRREAQPARDGRRVARRIAQLVGRDPEVVGLLRERQAQSVTVVQRAAARFQHDALGALRLRDRRVFATLDELHLRGPKHQRDEREAEADLHNAQSHEGVGH